MATKKITKAKKDSAAAATTKRTSKKTSAKKTKSLERPSFQNYFNQVKIPEALKKTRNIYIAAGIIGIVLLAVLISKYLVVAWVDKNPITAFQYYQTLDQKYGKEVKEQLIVEQLITNEAIKRRVSVSDNDVNTEIGKIEKEQGGKDKLNEILQIQGISESEFRNLVRLQLLRQKMFGENIEVKDDEVNKFIEENKNQYPEVTNEIKTQVKEQLKQQKITTSFQEWLRDALQSTRVKRTNA